MRNGVAVAVGTGEGAVVVVIVGVVAIGVVGVAIEAGEAVAIEVGEAVEEVSHPQERLPANTRSSSPKTHKCAPFSSKPRVHTNLEL